ncbi:MAG: hypothetical protein J6C91_05070 [Muribaculaceae bacterium]|nr:hypothetical protein [Muribaculaceae bacterium]
MAEATSHIKCTDQDFLTSARKWRKEFLRMPVHRVAEVLPFFTIRPGIRYEEKVMDIDADLQFGPYDPKRTEQLDVDFGARVLKTFFGSVRREFDPNEYYKTVLGSSITKGEALKSTEIARMVLSVVTGKLGNHLCKHIFDAVRDDKGTTSKTLFNGLDTITQKEITDGNISVEKGNLYTFTEKIDKTNAVDAVTEFCRSADDFLAETEGLNLLMPRSVYYAYLDDYKATTGAIPYNQQFKQIHPEGFENITFRPMFQKKDSQFMQLANKSNLLIGVNQMGEEESIVVEKHDVVMLTLFATIFFGCDYESIIKERLLVGQLYKAPTSTGGGSQTSTETEQTGES